MENTNMLQKTHNNYNKFKRIDKYKKRFSGCIIAGEFIFKRRF